MMIVSVNVTVGWAGDTMNYCISSLANNSMSTNNSDSDVNSDTEDNENDDKNLNTT